MLIRDSIHGDVELSPAETRVLDCPEMQRLRSIKQLGTAYLVYPGCTHSRFEHSLGTMAVAKKILAVLEGTVGPIDAETKQLVGIAALLHDITHIPFGHTFEDERKIFARHDKGFRLKFLLRQESYLGKALDELGLRTQVQYLLAGEASDWRSQIVSSALDADLLDYLRRDALMAGLAQTYDTRFFQHFTIINNELVLNLVKHNMDRPDVKSEIMHLLRLRYYLTERVYFHHAKVISGAMISKALELALQYGLEEADLLNLGDYTLLEHLKQLGIKNNPAISNLVAAVESRRLLKRAYILTPDSISRQSKAEFINEFHFKQETRARLEAEISRSAGLDPSQVIIYCPGDRTFREAGIPVLTKDGLRKLNSPVPIPPEEILLLEKQYQRLWRFYVFAPEAYVERVKQVCQATFGIGSEHC